MLKKEVNRQIRHYRIRKKVAGTAERPRLALKRSLNHLHVQVINDDEGKTIVGFSTSSKAFKSSLKTGGNVAAAKELGKLCAAGLKEKGITKIAFDRAGYLFHGRVKALAEALREAGINF